jgi:hypothetical protein
MAIRQDVQQPRTRSPGLLWRHPPVLPGWALRIDGYPTNPHRNDVDDQTDRRYQYDRLRSTDSPQSECDQAPAPAKRTRSLGGGAGIPASQCLGGGGAAHSATQRRLARINGD